MNKEILAAHASNDARRLLELLRNRGRMSPVQMADIQRRNQQSEPISELLLPLVGEAAVAQLLFDRFRENLFEFMYFADNDLFYPMDTIFVDNIQTGHNSRSLIKELSNLHQLFLAAELTPSRIFTRTALASKHSTLAPGLDTQVLGLIQGRTRLEQLINLSPLERTSTLSALLRLLERGLIQDPTMPPPSPNLIQRPKVKDPDISEPPATPLPISKIPVSSLPSPPQPPPAP
jgi:hypothetical protein